MDLLEIVKSKVKTFEGSSFKLGIDAVVHHIEISESHFHQAKSSGEHLFTDVIYRTNQAFEGALKEAYRVIKNENPERKSPFEIEKYFEESNSLKPRVLSQFSNYRTEWRNKSTHDYQLFFSPQEALLAIVSVTAFFNILLDQMIEKISFDEEKEKLNRELVPTKTNDTKYVSLDFMNQCIELLNSFSKELKDNSSGNTQITEHELSGKIAAFISSLDPSIEIFADHPIGDGYLRADFLLRKGGDSVVLELKNPTQEYFRRALRAKEQLRRYMIDGSVRNGIVYAPVLRSSAKTEIEYEIIESPIGNLNIAIITPPVGGA